MANRNDLFDDEPEKPEQPKARAAGGEPAKSPGAGGFSRRRFLVGAGTAAAAGAAVGTGVTVAVNSMGSGGSSASAANGSSHGVTFGVPDGETVTASVVHLNVNGKDQFVSVLPNESLVEVLREKLGMTGTKEGCDRSECGACTVLVDGVPHNSCSLLAIREEGKSITTIEGLANGTTLSPVQQAFVDNMAFQCGFCTSGQILQATALLKSNPNPDEATVRHALSGNLCKCAAYPNILAAVQAAAKAKTA